MTNGRRRPAPGGARRGGAGGRRPAAARRQESGRRPEQGRRQEPGRRPAPGRRQAAGRGGYDVPASGLGGLHPAILAGMIVVPVLLVVVIVMAATSGDDTPKKAPTYEPVQNDANANLPPPPIDPGATKPVKIVRPPTKAEMDMLERSWAPLRGRARKMRELRDEGVEYWHKQDKANSQKAWHAANREWQYIRDRGWELLGRFSDEQVDKYLENFEIELINWGKVFKTFSKNLDISE